MKDEDSGENKGFAFVTFRSAELASNSALLKPLMS